MKQETIFDTSVWLVVIAVHIAALSAAWQGKPPRVSVGASVLQVVDLGDFQAGNNETPAPPAPAVEKPKPVVQPEKPVKKKITAVKKPDKKPDIVVKKE